MTTLTIPKNLIKERDLVIIPRREYESMVDRIASMPEEIVVSLGTRKKIDAARKRIKAGKYLTLDEFNQKMDVAHR